MAKKKTTKKKTKSMLEENKQYHFFWNGPFSQWASSDFVDENYPDLVFNCAEQYMMYRKALLMEDTESAERIYKARRPADQKSMGRSIKNFDQQLWDEHKFDIVVTANILKFSQNQDLLNVLKKEGHKKFVEASPYDTIWGIGMDESLARTLPEDEWAGENLLGKALDKVKELLIDKR